MARRSLSTQGRVLAAGVSRDALTNVLCRVSQLAADFPEIEELDLNPLLAFEDRGTHVLKALSLGAKAVSGGRLYLYALAAAGQAGVERALAILEAEIVRDMKLMGVTRIDQLNRENLRFRAKGMAANRKRLGLSAADFGLLVGATGQSIYAWETGKTKPRPQALAAIAALRGIGKREVEARLASLKG